MIIPKFFGEVSNGKLIIKNRDIMDNYLLSLDGEVEVIIMKPEKNRSLSQSRYYYGVVVRMISEETGNSPELVHKDLKDDILKWVTPKVSTSQLTTVEFKEYIERCKMFASMELNLNIPDSTEIYT